MIPASFDYIAAKSLDEAISLLAKHKDDAKILAGGHSLLPAMKLRLMQPKVLIDLGRIRDLSYIKEEGGQIRIGAMTTHDLGLADEEPLKSAATFLHFSETLDPDGTMRFDYTLKPGLATSRNALRLMQMIGIDL